jgi:plastocyanin
MLRARFIVPVAVLAISSITAVLPTVTSAQSGPAPISIVDNGDISTWGYGPSTTTVTVGQPVMWTNSGTSPHDATATDGSWGTPLLQTGQSALVTFSTPGTFAYTCVVHPWMQGTIVVTPAAGGG